MAVKSFTCWLTYHQLAQTIEDVSERGEFWCAFMDYMFEDCDREQELSQSARMAMICAKAHGKTSKSRSYAGMSGNKQESNGKQNESNGNQNAIKTESNGKQDKDKDKVQDKDKGENRFKNVLNLVCPTCGHLLCKNTSTGRFDCPSCCNSFSFTEAVQHG